MRKQLWSLVLLISVLLIAGCGQDTGGENSDNLSNDKIVEENNKSVNEENGFPREVDVYGTKVSIEAKPEKIAALSLNVAEIVVDLAGPEKIIVVTSSAENENLSNIANEVEKIPNRMVGAVSLDPEVVLSYDPDLVLLALTHGAEQDANQLLEKAGVPLASFEQWRTVDDLLKNYRIIGQLIGEEEKAEKVVKELEEKITQVQEQVKEKEEAPSVLILSQVGPNTGPYILGPSSIAYDLIKIAGGTPASDLVGLENTTPASIEQILAIDPDFIILVEWGETSGEFSELLDSAAFQTLEAVEKGNVKTIPAKSISQANRYVIDTLKEIATWIHE